MVLIFADEVKKKPLKNWVFCVLICYTTITMKFILLAIGAFILLAMLNASLGGNPIG